MRGINFLLSELQLYDNDEKCSSYNWFIGVKDGRLTKDLEHLTSDAGVQSPDSQPVSDGHFRTLRHIWCVEWSDDQ